MWLAVDHGNTRIKWTRIRGPRHDGIRSTDKGDLSPLAAAAREATAVWISHVGSEAEKKAATTSPKTPPTLPTSKKSVAAASPTTTAPPASLGTDRWLCLLAARPRRKAVIIISAGTALTIDGLSADGHFIGGVILPGLQLMSSSLATATSLPPAATAPQTTPSPPPHHSGSPRPRPATRGNRRHHPISSPPPPGRRNPNHRRRRRNTIKRTADRKPHPRPAVPRNDSSQVTLPIMDGYGEVML